MNRPRLKTEGTLLPGLGAVALFAVFAAVFLTAAIPSPSGFEGGTVMRSLGAAMFNLDPAAVAGDGSPIPSEGFLVAFEIVDAVLVAALVGAVMLARREEAGENVTVGTDASAPESDAARAAATDGGTTEEGDH